VLSDGSGTAYYPHMSLTHLDGAGLRGALIAASGHVRRYRAELNRINVFPVPDGDTGTNLALTVSALADRLRGSTSGSLGVVAKEAAEAGAKGFVHLLEGMGAFLSGAPLVVDEAPDSGAGPMAAAQVEYPAEEEAPQHGLRLALRQEALQALVGDLVPAGHRPRDLTEPRRLRLPEGRDHLGGRLRLAWTLEEELRVLMEILRVEHGPPPAV
jgi:hypothetical protein